MAILKKYTTEILIDKIKQFVNEYNRIPKSIDFDKSLNGYPSRKVIIKEFGNFIML